MPARARASSRSSCSTRASAVQRGGLGRTSFGGCSLDCEAGRVELAFQNGNLRSQLPTVFLRGCKLCFEGGDAGGSSIELARCCVCMRLPARSRSGLLRTQPQLNAHRGLGRPRPADRARAAHQRGRDPSRLRLSGGRRGSSRSSPRLRPGRLRLPPCPRGPAMGAPQAREDRSRPADRSRAARERGPDPSRPSWFAPRLRPARSRLAARSSGLAMGASQARQDRLRPHAALRPPARPAPGSSDCASSAKSASTVGKGA